MIGRKVSHYEILEEIGSGGMGVIYRARDTRLNRSVAFKVLPAALADEPERRARFLQEARSAGGVSHPAIAQIYDVDEADGVTFIAMELVEGRTVRKLITDREIDVLSAVEIAIHVAQGLAKAHEAGIVHRDIKSENIIVTPEGHAKILDFGLAKSVGGGEEHAADGAAPDATLMKTLAATQHGMVVGTIGYMSPEQARGRPLDHRSDLFSLGVVLYEMIAGERPFQGESPLDTLHAIAFEETRPVTAVRSNVPASLHRVLVKCLRKLPQDRYDSAQLLVRDLEGVARDIDSGITSGVPLAERLREGWTSLREAAPADWVVPALVAAGVTALLILALRDGTALPALLPVGLVGLLIFRRLKNKRYRLARSFAKQAAKMEEVKLVAVHGERITVVVERPMAKTYVHLNSQVEKINSKLFFGERFALRVRENVAGVEMRTLLESPGVFYVSEDALIPADSAS